MKKQLLLIALVLIFTRCSKQNNAAPPAAPTVKIPTVAVLTFPTLNEVCTTGTVLSATQSSITFTWNASTNTDSYDLSLKNLLTGVTTTQNTTQTQLAITVARNTPYSWYIVSKSTKTSTTAQSDVFKFYNAGLPTVTYAPFPAGNLLPTFGQSVTATNGTINLSWAGSVVSTDVLANYDVYFGTTNNPPIIKSAVTDSFLNNVAVTSKTTYYWKVITRDASGNTSDSGLYQFSVN